MSRPPPPAPSSSDTLYATPRPGGGARERSAKHVLGGALILGGIVAAGVLTYVAPVGQSRLYPGCALYDWTGLYCTGCGATRAVSALAHGQFLDAVTNNAVLVASLPILVVVALNLLWRGLTGRPFTRWLPPLWLAIALGVLLALYTILRNVPAFAFLAPLPVGP